ncbi:MAG: helix-turn-helix transcriptional regulator [Planctomycetes bacterium]|nr:helix-turn-helix transcriptional regulator [Planctomycetota bacterium]
MIYEKLRSDFPEGPGAFLRDIVDWALLQAENDRLSYVPVGLEGVNQKNAVGLLHPFPEIFIQLRGTNRFSLPCQQFDLEPGQATVIPPWMSHVEDPILTADDFLMLVVSPYIESSSLHFSLRNKRAKPKLEQHWEYLNSSYGLHLFQVCRGFSYAANFPPDTGNQLCRGIMLTILAYISNHFRTNVTVEYSPLVAAARHYIGRNFHEPSLSVKSVARELRCNYDYLCNLHHRETGEKLSQYIRQQRLSLSRELLLGTTYSIKEICLKCGFSSPNHFSSVFSKAYRMSPTQYRKDTFNLVHEAH